MEISYVASNALKLKGKSASLAINPTAQINGYNGALIVGNAPDTGGEKDAVVFDGPGEFEVGGIKVTGIRDETGLAYHVLIDGIDILVGSVETLAKIQNKVKEPQILLLATEKDTDVSFVSSYESRVAMFYGTAAVAVAEKLLPEGLTKVSKYSITREKLPEELLITVLQ